MSRTILIKAVIFISALSGVGQIATIAGDSKWVRITSPAQDISVVLPENAFLVDNEDGEFRVYYSESGISFSFEVDPRRDAKETVKMWRRTSRDAERYRHFDAGDFLIQQYVPEEPPKEGDSIFLYLASSKGLYRISAHTRDAESVTYKELLHQIEIGGKSLIKNAGPIRGDLAVVPIGSLRTDEKVLAALRMPDSKQRKLEKGEEDKSEKPKIQYSRSLRILRKLKPGYTDSARMSNSQGIVVLRVAFLATGQIGPIAILKSLDRGLDKTSFEAAKKIKFLPAEVEGRPVDQIRNVEYSFSIF